MLEINYLILSYIISAICKCYANFVRCMQGWLLCRVGCYAGLGSSTVLVLKYIFISIDVLEYLVYGNVKVLVLN